MGEEALPARRLLAVCCLLVLVALAGCDGDGRYLVCAVCEPQAFAETDSEAVAGSELDIRLAEAGDSRWTATVRLTADAEVPSRTAIWDALHGTSPRRFSPVHEGDAQNVTIERRPAGYRVAFTVPDVATRVDETTMVVGYFHNRRHGGPPHSLGADIVALHAPPGMAVSNTPPGSTVTADGSTVVWRDDGPPAHNDIGSETYVVLDTDRTVATSVRAQALVAERVVAYRWPGALLSAVPGSLGVGAAALWVVSRLSAGSVWRRLRGAPCERSRVLAGSGLALLGVLGAIFVRLPVGTNVGALLTELLAVGCLGVALLVATTVAAARDHWTQGPLVAALVALPLYSGSLIELVPGGTPGVDLLWVQIAWTAFAAGGGLLAVAVVSALFGYGRVEAGAEHPEK